MAKVMFYSLKAKSNASTDNHENAKQILHFHDENAKQMTNFHM